MPVRPSPLPHFLDLVSRRMITSPPLAGCRVHLVCLVHRVGLIQPNKREKPNKPEQPEQPGKLRETYPSGHLLPVCRFVLTCFRARSTTAEENFADPAPVIKTMDRRPRGDGQTSRHSRAGGAVPYGVLAQRRPADRR